MSVTPAAVDIRHGYALSFGKINSPAYIEAGVRFDRWYAHHATRVQDHTLARMIREGWQNSRAPKRTL